ncbi:MAG: hypothetical protein OHK0023_24700 [Anaerolineae bacterium]
MAIYTLRASAKRLSLSRVVFTGFPRGQTLGMPNDRPRQLEILRQALTHLSTAGAPLFQDRGDDRP